MPEPLLEVRGVRAGARRAVRRGSDGGRRIVRQRPRPERRGGSRRWWTRWRGGSPSRRDRSTSPVRTSRTCGPVIGWIGVCSSCTNIGDAAGSHRQLPARIGDHQRRV